MTVEATTDHATEGGSAGSARPGARGISYRGACRPITWQERQLRAIEKMCDEREARICAALSEDLGRSAFEGWLGDVASTKAEAAFAAKHLRKWVKREAVRSAVGAYAGPGVGAVRPARSGVDHRPVELPFFLCLSPLVSRSRPATPR